MIDFEWDITKAKTNLRKLMKMKSKDEKADELRPEYDLFTLLKEGVRGKYVKRYEQGTNPILFGMDIAISYSVLKPLRRIEAL